MAYKALQIAHYFLSKDPQGQIFNKDLTDRNGRRFYIGNAILNKLLHLAQNIFIARNGRVLFDDVLYAYDNGAVVPVIQENYAAILMQDHLSPLGINLSDDDKIFLDKFYDIFSVAPLDDLIALSHEDPEWEKKHSFYSKPEQQMCSVENVDIYRKQYADIISIMEAE